GPQRGERVHEGTGARWLKQVGEPVERYESLLEVNTDKVNSEVPSTTAGVLTQILVQEGETVPVGAAIAVIDEVAAAGAPAAGGGEPAAAGAGAGGRGAGAGGAATAAPVGSGGGATAAPPPAP